MELFDASGQRKYLTSSERDAFEHKALNLEDNEVRTFCLMLLYSGCRISEALDVLVKRIDFASGAVVGFPLDRTIYAADFFTSSALFVTI